MAKVFNRVGVPRPGRSVFNLTYEKKFTGFFGKLYPSMVDEVVPGDVIDITKEIVIRLMPLVAPILHEVNIMEYTFFVPYRLLMTEELGDDGDFEDMIIGGSDGDTDIAIPYWAPSSTAKYSLWDYMGFPIGIDPGAGHRPVDFPKRAYNMIWNEYFRDVDLQTEIDITTAESIAIKAWEKDFFTSARPWQQRGTSPALPISGVLDIDPKDQDIEVYNENDATVNRLATNTSADVQVTGSAPSANGDMRWSDPALSVDLGSGVTFDINDIRLAVQTQKWMERNARAGTRYKEFLTAHFGVTVPDGRLQRPEYIGGLKQPIIISEVLQTESSDASTDLGTMAGHGLSVSTTRIGKFRVREYGLIMSILAVIPRTAYSQGIDRQWTKDSLYDFYFPEFSNLSEQPVYRKEIYADTSGNDTVFGYQGRYNEMRIKRNVVCADLAAGQSFNYWTFAREFASAPSLTGPFVRSVNSTGFEGGIRSDIFAASSSIHMLVSVGNRIKAVRPLPILANPGYLDHN